MMKILTLNAPFYPKFSRSQRSPAVIKSGVMYYPIWLSYATGVLEQDGFDVRLIDAPADSLSLQYVLDFCKEFKPEMVVIDTSTPSIGNDLRVADAIKNELKDVFLMMVGPHVTARPNETLLAGQSISAIARGEYDFTVRDAARALAGGSDFASVSGLTFKSEGGEVVVNPDRPLIRNLDDLPFVTEVYKRHLHVENYFYSITQYPEVAIITGRGCPYQCTYCVWPQTITGHGYRTRSVENVADEFDFVAREFPQVKEIFIEDDTLTVNQRRSKRLAEELIRRGNKLPFTANSRADVTYETLDALHKSGLRLVCVGFESGDQEVLNNIKKDITVEQFYKFRDDARKARVMVHGCFMAGNAGETQESLRKTLDLALNMNPDTAQFFPIMLYPGTEAYDWADSKGYLLTNDYENWLTDEGLHKTIINLPGLTAEEVVAWCDQSRRSFYLRPYYIMQKFIEIISKPREIGRITRASRTFFRYLFRPSISKSYKSKEISDN